MNEKSATRKRFFIALNEARYISWNEAEFMDSWNEICDGIADIMERSTFLSFDDERAISRAIISEAFKPKE